MFGFTYMNLTALQSIGVLNRVSYSWVYVQWFEGLLGPLEGL